MSAPQKTGLAHAAAFEMTRRIDAKPDAVWAAWSNADALEQWWGPKGFPPCHVELDFRVGGGFHYGLQMPDDQVMWGRLDYRAMTPAQQLDFVVQFSDEHGGGPTRHPFDPDWPLLSLVEIEFHEDRGATRLNLRWTPLDATAREIERFSAGHADCQQGWDGTLDQLDKYLMEDTQ